MNNDFQIKHNQKWFQPVQQYKSLLLN